MSGNVEDARLDLQARLDAGKTVEERRRLGQFATPTALARGIVDLAAHFIDGGIRFMDPAFGTGSFYSALLYELGPRVETAVGYEVDPYYCVPAAHLWDDGSLDLRNRDFLEEQPSVRCNLLVCNPPYTRHHLIGQNRKKSLHDAVEKDTGINLSGLSGLYCYYLLRCHYWLEPGAVSAWLVPSEFMDVGYGAGVKEYLLHHVDLLRIHRFDPREVQFDDALVSSAVVLFVNRPPASEGSILFSYGGTLDSPARSKAIDRRVLEDEPKWTRFPLKDERRASCSSLSDYFTVKRGVVTGDNGFFIMNRIDAEDLGIPSRYLVSILPPPRAMKEEIVLSDGQGRPSNVAPLVLLDCTDDIETVRNVSPLTFRYLMSGEGDVSERYICRNRRVWYQQEQREPPPILCSYMGRGNEAPFRFILNRTDAIATNSYLLLYPTNLFKIRFGDSNRAIERAWMFMKANSGRLFDEGRVYGGGLKKIEPRELMSMDAQGFEEFMLSDSDATPQSSRYCSTTPVIESGTTPDSPGSESSTEG